MFLEGPLGGFPGKIGRGFQLSGTVKSRCAEGT
jgi:hypothetical protein